MLLSAKVLKSTKTVMHSILSKHKNSNNNLHNKTTSS